jgi:hypothetical protein
MKTNEHKITKISFLVMKILLGVVFVFELDRFVTTIILSPDLFNIWNYIAHSIILVAVTVLFILILFDNKKVPLLWYFVFIMKLLSFIPLTSVFIYIWPDGLVSLLFLTVSYYVVPFVLTIVDVIFIAGILLF